MKSLLKRIISNEDELNDFASDIRSLIKKNSIILLSGDLSAGKTTFVSSFCELFEIRLVQSPTYSLHQRYSNNQVVIDHFDLYRLSDNDEVESSGFYDQINSVSDYKFIEWPERIFTDYLPVGTPLYLIKIIMISSVQRQMELYLFSD